MMAYTVVEQVIQNVLLIENSPSHHIRNLPKFPIMWYVIVHLHSLVIIINFVNHSNDRLLVQVACQTLMTIIGELAREILSDKLIVISSDFKRAKETAKIMHQYFHVKAPLRLERSLRERNFGELNLTESSNYQRVWAHDAQDPNHTIFGCESVMSVFSRTSVLIESLEAEYKNKGKVIVLVSHGDTLQITLTAYAGVAPECHRTLDHLANCDVRELIRSVDR